MDDAEQFLPLYLRFVKGVVDSADLPLNISREMLQQDAAIDSMRTGLARRVLDLLAKVAKDEPEKYATFWKEFGTVLKEGPGRGSRQSRAHRQAPALLQHARGQGGAGRVARGLRRAHEAGAEGDLLRDRRQLRGRADPARTSKSCAARASKCCCSRTASTSGSSITCASSTASSCATSRAASWTSARCSPTRRSSSGRRCRRSTARWSSASRRRSQERVSDVRVTNRLADSPACLVLGEHDLGAQMRRILEAAGQKVPAAKPVLEINVTHPLLQRIESTAEAAAFDDLTMLLFDQATLADGGQLAEPAAFVQRLNRLLLTMH